MPGMTFLRVLSRNLFTILGSMLSKDNKATQSLERFTTLPVQVPTPGYDSERAKAAAFPN